MTKSQSYVAERSRILSSPIVLFDGAEVEIFMGDLSLFPVVAGPVIRGWQMSRVIVFTKFSANVAEAEVLSLVLAPKVNYGFAVMPPNGRGETRLGVYERVPVEN